MIILSIFTIIALIMIGLLHVYWALGGIKGFEVAIPTQNGERLINPGKIMTLIVGLVLFGFAFVAYMLSFYDLSSSPYRDYFIMSGWILSGIFTLRGIGNFNSIGLFKKIKSSKFAYYDTRFYTPFVFILGFIFAVLASKA